MERFRYAQFCPLARAAEILGHRWVLPILRELLVGPQRFSDLKRRLHGVSTSVLADRLVALEASGVVARSELPPPASSSVYELTADGRALEPALLALTRWGVRFVLPPRPGDHVEPDWVTLAVRAFGRSAPTPPLRFELCIRGEDREAVLRFAGGPQGTHLLDDDGPVDARLSAPPTVVLGLMSGLLASDAALASGSARLEGDASALAALPHLFEMDLPSPDVKGNAS